jgi:YHS domain-containing protein
MSALSILRSAIIAVSLLFAAIAASVAVAGSVNEVQGLAIKGFDPVAYFIDQKAVPGSAEFTHPYDGVTYRFSSAAHRDAFIANPQKYLPAYGGFCAFGTASGYKADIDPKAFTVVDGKLYLNYNQDVRSKWQQDIPGYIKTADEKWPTVSKSTDVIR